MEDPELTPARRVRNREPEVEAAWSVEELRAAFRKPDRILAVALGEPGRVGRNLTESTHLGLLMALLLLCGLAGTAAYGLLSPARNLWSTSVLFYGSFAICFPSLHVFSVFHGTRLGLSQTLALALTLTGAAGLFALGFAPIVWFLDWSIRIERTSVVTPRGLSFFLLGAALLLGILQLIRCLLACRGHRPGAGMFLALVLLWLPLFVFITCRMASLLGLP